ncbi:type II toxin-antitoxin system prevent-host-death family antitoxin [Actinomadura welshii]|uniref:Prevent-host-death family protein n=1 Tax=Actinomadura livida TaxID=79909 RepID=A0A7W7IJ67_9ACTN|nr:type II toxin-antitoxin system prevent-host-death family antitoxin [Actinomadura catellatispora]MBB4778092.1 prevent-host-death family protein [Actinomadura catellatispora]
MESEEMSVADARRQFADVLNDAAVRGRITYITNRGRRIAAVVPVPIAETADQDHDGR